MQFEYPNFTRQAQPKPSYLQGNRQSRLEDNAEKLFDWIKGVLRSPERFSDAELDEAEKLSLAIGD